MTTEEKYAKLLDSIQGMGKAAVAFSGGADSSFLCKVARDVLGDGAVAVTVVSPMLPKSELESAKRFAAMVDIRHLLVEEKDIEECVAVNPANRCYHCKRIEFGAVRRAAAEVGISWILDGSNRDDLADYRPGLAALTELGIVSPLRDADLTKAEIRELSRQVGLPTWNKPAAACLASRIPYGERIDAHKLARVEEAEEFLCGLGLVQFRVRSHGDMARIEVAPDERIKLYNTAVMDRVSARLKALGFLYVCMDLEGYATGSMNRAIKGREGAANG